MHIWFNAFRFTTEELSYSTMQSRKNIFLRLIGYSILAILFGVIEWFYSIEALIQQILNPPPTIFTAYAVWIAAGVVVAVIESTFTRRTLLVCLQTIWFLLIAVIS